MMLPVYDLETYPNIFTCAVTDFDSDDELFFEISDWVDQGPEFMAWLHTLRLKGSRMIGFNNLFFDYGVLDWMLKMFGNHKYIPRPHEIAAYATQMINTNENNVKPWELIIPQIDLYKINHFDNKAKRTSLKQLEFAMQADSVMDLPYPPGTMLQPHEAEVLRQYNKHDTRQTKAFAKHCAGAIKFREELTLKFDKDFTNANDTKVGKDYLKMKLGFDLCGTSSQPRQTVRQHVALANVIFPYITFDHPEFNRVMNYLKSQVLQRVELDEINSSFNTLYAGGVVPLQTKGVFKGLSATVDGFQFDFGVGGIHGSIEAQAVYADEQYAIIDLDVTSYYPSLSIANRIFPAHLSERWCDEHVKMKGERKKYAKKTAENLLYKLALNGSFGDTNNVYSAFYDPAYTMAITVNGQLLLCKLAEQLMLIPGLQMIQANTDGVTVRCPRTQLQRVEQVKEWWQRYTLLDLEQVEYRRMFIRDVNNYIAEGTDGSIKRKGVYEWDYVTTPQWHKNFSGLVIAKAVEKHLLTGQPLAQLIETHPIDHDFCMMVKCPRSNRLELDGVPQQKIVRYYVATDGGELVKIAPPTEGYEVGQWKRANSVPDHTYREVLRECTRPDAIGVRDVKGAVHDERIHTKNKSMYQNRKTGIEAGRKVMVCNQMHFFTRQLLDYSYYLGEAQKLVVG